MSYHFLQFLSVCNYLFLIVIHTRRFLPWMNSVLLCVRPKVFHDVSLVCDRRSSVICLMYEPLRTLSGVFVHRVERNFTTVVSLQWRHNERDGASNHRRLDCLLNRLFRRRSKKTSKLRVTGIYEGKPPVTGGFPSRGKCFHLIASSWHN